MSRLPRRSYLLAPALALAVAMSVSACGNNGVAIQSNEHSNAQGASGDISTMQVRNADITLGIGGEGTLSVGLFNTAQQADQLVSVSSPAASSFALPAATPSPLIGGPVSPTATAPASSGAAGSSGPVTVPPQNGVLLDTFSTQIVLSGLTGSPAVGQSLPVTFTFAAAGSLTLQVPIVAANLASTGVSPLPSVTAAGAASGPPSSTPPVTVTATQTVTPTPAPTAPATARAAAPAATATAKASTKASTKG